VNVASVRRVVNRLLVHRYTRIPRVPSGTLDTLNDATVTSSTEVTGLHCQFGWKQSHVPTPQGYVLVSEPTLTLQWDADIEVGDLIKNITTRKGVILLAGPATVERLDAPAELGEPVEKIATLRTAQPIPEEE
jgi:hypothetical protein